MNTAMHEPRRDACPRRADAAAWALGRLDGRAARHLARCAECAAEAKAVRETVRRVRADAPPQSDMENSITQAANVLDAFRFGRPDGAPLPPGPGLVIDDTLRSGWTMTVVAEGLREAGAESVLPFVLWRRP